MDNHNPESCPKCGVRNIGRAKQSGYAAVNVKGALLGKAMIHYFCKDCGFVIESYIHKPRP